MSFLLVAFLGFYFSACKKDSLKGTFLVEEAKNISLTPQLAQSWFELKYGKSKLIIPPRNLSLTIDNDSHVYLNETFTITPQWTSSKISTYLQASPIVLVPIESIAFLDSKNLSYVLVCFIDSTQNINGRLQIYKATEKYHNEHTNYDVKTFSGMFFQIGLEGSVERIYGLKDGQFVSRLNLKKPSLNTGLSSNKGSLTTRSNWQGCWSCGSVPGYQEAFPVRCFFCTLGFGDNDDEVTYDGTNSHFFYGSLGFGNPSTNIYPSATGSFDSGFTGSAGSSNNSYSSSSTWGLSNEIDNSMFDINAELYEQQNKQNYVLLTLNPTGIEKVFLDNNKLIYNQLYDYLMLEGDYIGKKTTAQQHLQLLIENEAYYRANQNAGFPKIGSKQWEDNVINPFFTIEQVIQYHTWCAILRHQNPSWSLWRIKMVAAWNTSKEILHTSLDLLGMIPAGGEPFDAANGIFYLIEGDGVNASLSFSATIPFAGWLATGAKYASISIKTLGGAEKILPLIKNEVTGLIEFGSRSDLRKVLNITDDTKEAHHIIPWAKSVEPLVQKAAGSMKKFHMNHKGNGIELPKYRANYPDGIHANHPAYDTRVQNHLNVVWQGLLQKYGSASNIPVDEARDKLIDLQDNIKKIIIANPNVKLNDLIF